VGTQTAGAAEATYEVEQLHRRYEETFRRASEESARRCAFTVGGQPVDATIAGSALAATLRRSLFPGDGGVGLRLHLWDEAETGVSAPDRLPGDPFPDRNASGERFILESSGRYGRYSSPDFEVHLDRARDRAIGWIRAEAALEYWHRARPLRTLFTSWLSDRGCAVLHAAMVAFGDCGLALPAKSHSGKSTCAAACLAAGMDVLGDETLAIEERDGVLLGHGLHGVIKLRRHGIDAHGELATRLHSMGPGWPDDLLGYLQELHPRRLRASAPLRAIAFPRPASERGTTYERVSAARALRLLAGCLLSVGPADLAGAFDVAASICRRLPAYVLDVGTDPAGIPMALRALGESTQ
jgi:hypothetical protein